ncbi:baculoviral IAP repeat-containing protein 3-like [Bombus pascuorum]|uniref:baculoviral IAP repeat-containing protein 3-like n=1 Tax=Bombus pascuorum TaxID=65598 RepID=UPI00298E099B|nr:baculoviral IAP repeat-containing protein 3-like [Bombus pascuorum]
MLPMQTINPMSSVPSTSRGIQERCDLRFETARLLTFRNWPVYVAIPLAAAGFFYTGTSNTIKCFVCQVKLNYRLEPNTPMQIHKAYSPECGFVRNQNCGNVPMKRQSRLGSRTVSKEANSKYHTYESRLGTFATWPNTHIKSEELADAGFYFNGVNDTVVCHHCGIAMDNWSPGEDPWNRHAISSPGCCYTIKARGLEYIKNVTGQDFYETLTEARIETTVGNHERSHDENETDEMTLVEKCAALEQENQELEDARSCKVCMRREATIAFLPCGHLATCNYCAPAFLKCIICREEVKAVVRIASA